MSKGFKILLAFFLILFVSADLLSQKDSLKKSDLKLDLGLTRGGNVNLWPVFKKFKSSEKSELQILYPVFSRKINYLAHSRHLQVLPFYIADSSSRGIDKRILSFYYPSFFHYHTHKDSSGSYRSFRFMEFAPDISLLNIGRSTNGLFVENNFLFLLWYKQNKTEQRSHLVIFPAYWNFSSRTDTTKVLFPLYFEHRNARQKSVNFALVYNYRKSKERKHISLFPLFWHNEEFRSDDTIKHNTLFPVYWARKSNREDNKIFFPVVYSIKNDQHHSFTVFPLFSKGQRADSSSWLAVTPFYWHFKSQQTTKNVLFPLFWNTREYTKNDTLSKTILFPFFLRKSSNDETRTFIFPFISSVHNKNIDRFTFLPLFSVGQNHNTGSKYFAVTPFFWHIKEKNRERNILFPIFWSVKDSTKEKTVLFPLYFSHRSEDRSSTTLFPLYSAGVNSDSSSWFVLSPFFWNFKSKKEETNIIFPFIWNHQRFLTDDTISKKVFFPLYWSTRSRNNSRTVLLPFIFTKKTPELSSITVLPLFSWRRDKDSSLFLSVTPFFHHIKNKNETWNVLFPVYWNKTRHVGGDTSRKNVLFPVYYSTKSKTENNKVFFPFVFSYKNSERKSFTLFPFFSHTESTDGKNEIVAVTPFYWHVRSPNLECDIFFPLFWNKKIFLKNDTLNKTIFFPLYWASKNKLHNNKIIFPLVYSYRDEYRKSFTVFPLFHYYRTNDGRKSRLAVTPIYWRDKTREEERTVLFPLYWGKKSFLSDDTVYRKLFLPVYWSKQSKTEKNKIFFPIAWSFSDKRKESFTLLPLFSYGKRKDNSSSYLAVTPFFWHTRDKKGERNVFFPLFWNSKLFSERDTTYKTVFFPFVFSRRNENGFSFTVFPLFSYGKTKDGDQSHLMLSPLFWKIHNQKEERTVLFPLYRNHKTFLSDDTVSRTFIFPLYWSRKSKDAESSALFPFVFTYKDKEREALTIIPFFRYGKNSSTGENHFAITPFFWHIHEKKRDKNILFPLYWNSKTYLSNDTVRRNVLFPLYWSRTNNSGSSRVLFPIVFSKNTKEKISFTFFPLFSFGHNKNNTGSYFAVTPFFWHVQRPGKIRNILFPLFWNSKRFLSDDTISKTVLFPLVWSKRSKDKTSLTMLPLFSYSNNRVSQRKQLAVTPFFWHSENRSGKRNILFPLYWGRKEFFANDTVSKSVLFPIWWSYTSNERKNKVLFPIVFSLRNKNYQSFTLAPLFSFGRSPQKDRSHLLITPLFGHFKTADRTNSFLFPLFSYRKDKRETKFSALLFLLRSTRSDSLSRTSFLWPICEHVKTRNHSSFRFAPVFWSSRTDTSRMLSVQPFFYFKKNPSGNTFVLNWFMYKRETKTGISVTNSFLWRMLYNKKFVNGDFETRFLHLVYVNLKDQGKREIGVLPLFHTYRDTSGNRSFSLLFGLYNRFREYKPEVKDFYEEERILWFIRLRSNYKKLKAEGKGGFVRKMKFRTGNK